MHDLVFISIASALYYGINSTRLGYSFTSTLNRPLVIGLYLGFLQTLFCMILACVLGLLQALLSGKLRGKQFPFGPALSVAASLMLFFGGRLEAWYLDLLT